MKDQKRNTTDKVFGFIQAYTQEQGYPPTRREIAVGCGLSMGAITHQVEKLEKLGRIRRSPLVARSLVLVNPGQGER